MLPWLWLQVESKNKKEAQEIDRVFLIKQQREKETAEAEGQARLARHYPTLSPPHSA